MRRADVGRPEGSAGVRTVETLTVTSVNITLLTVRTTAPDGTAGAGEADEAFGIHELASRTGTSVRTIRYYQSKGLLPAPRRRGREARYGADHVERLGLIAELQARGLRLSAVREVLRNGGDALDVNDWLGLGEALTRPWVEDQPALLDDAALAERIEDTPPGTADALERVGVIERRTDTSPAVWFVPSQEMLDISLAWARLGLDLDAGARLRDRLRRRLQAAAAELVEGFIDEVGLEQLAGGGPAALTALIEQTQPLTRRTVELLFAQEMERAQRGLVDAATADGPTAPTSAPRRHTSPDRRAGPDRRGGAGRRRPRR